MGVISLTVLAAVTVLLLSRDTAEDRGDLQTVVPKGTTPSEGIIHPDCKMSSYHRPNYSECLKRVTCKWIMGKDFPDIARRVGERGVDDLHIEKCHLPLANKNEIDFKHASHPLQYLEKLKGLHIEGCQVKGIDENTFNSMTELHWLALINASLPRYLPSEVFGSLGKLKTLDLSRNELGVLSLRIGSTKLDWLVLRGCSLNRLDITCSTAEHFKLTLLDVTDNNLNKIAGLTQLIGNNVSVFLDGNPFDLHGKLFGEECNELDSVSVSVRNQRDIDKLGDALGNISVQSLSIFYANYPEDTDMEYFQMDALTDIKIGTLEIYDFSNLCFENILEQYNGSPNPFIHLNQVKALRLKNCAQPRYILPNLPRPWKPRRVFPVDMKSLQALSLNHVDLMSLAVSYPAHVTSLDLSFGTSSHRAHEHHETSNIKSLNFSSCTVEVRLSIPSIRSSLIEELILRNITLANNTVVRHITIWLAPLPKLRHLDLSANSNSYYPHIPFFTWIINVRDAFIGLENLEQLELNYTDIGEIDKEDLKYIFRPLKGLLRLDLDKSRISDIPEDTFMNQVNLEELHLADNQIRVIAQSTFRTLVRLKHLDLRNNRIEYIHGDAMGHLTSLPHRTFLFTGNNFGCHCDLAGFTRWLKEHNFPQENRCEWRNERCTVPLPLKDTPILDYQPAWMDCDDNLLILTVSSVFSVFLILATSVAIHSYRSRLSIRYWYVLQKLRRARSSIGNTATGTQNVDVVEPFDVFVSFEFSDRYWVQGTLLPHLENAQDITFRVCTVDRDLNDPGRPEVMNVAAGIQNTRNVIFVVTKEFVQTTWCEYEISLAETQHLQEGNCHLVVIFLEKFTWEELPLCLKRLLSHVNFLQWPETAHDRNEFWQRLRLVLLREARQSLTRVLYTRY